MSYRVVSSGRLADPPVTSAQGGCALAAVETVFAKWSKRSPALEQAYCLRQVLTGIFNSPFTKARATEAIEGWCEQVCASGLR